MLDQRPVTLTTDLKVHFDQLGTMFQTMVANKQEELRKIMEAHLESFDFDRVLEEHIHELINRSIKKAFDNIDPSNDLECMILEKLRIRINKISEGLEEMER